MVIFKIAIKTVIIVKLMKMENKGILRTNPVFH